MMAVQGIPTGPSWLQLMLTGLGLLGGTGGVAAIATVLVQKRKFRADTADVLTDTALTLVDPLKHRLVELETESADARQKVTTMYHEIDELRLAMREMSDVLNRLRSAILAPEVTIEQLRELLGSP